MPKLYEYLGLIIFFYSNKHGPVHVHARYQDYESKIEIILHEGKILKLNILQVAGKNRYQAPNLKTLKT
jgi:predicted RNA-binding protein with RPS1 domain